MSKHVDAAMVHAPTGLLIAQLPVPLSGYMPMSVTDNLPAPGSHTEPSTQVTRETSFENKSVGAASGLSAVKHVVVFMQENRAFDHYFGTMQGVRGFQDTSRLRFPNGSNVFLQPDLGPLGGAARSPWHLDTTKMNAQQADDLDHSWTGTHAAINSSLMNGWIPAKSAETMGFFKRNDIPYQYALADAFTLCDQYFCSVQGPTNPNRLYQWTGMIDPNSTGGGPVINNDEPGFSWKTYAEYLEQANVSWRV